MLHIKVYIFVYIYILYRVDSFVLIAYLVGLLNLFSVHIYSVVNSIIRLQTKLHKK